MSQTNRGSLGSAFVLGRDSGSDEDGSGSIASGTASPELRRSLAEVKGQGQFMLYLADQIDESLDQLSGENDSCHGAFLCKVPSMYSSQLESKPQGLGHQIAATCQTTYVPIRQVEAD